MEIQEILLKKKETKGLTGIYFLIKEDKIVYIGKSSNIENRVHSHSIEKTKDFDSYSYVLCETNELDEKEREYIKKYSPEYNFTYLQGKIKRLKKAKEEKKKEKVTIMPFVKEGFKVCKKCGINKELEEFHLDKKMKDGHKSFCKACRKRGRKFHNRLSDGRKKFDKNLNSAIYRSIKFNKSGRWERILDFSLEELKKQLELQFTSKMSWENYGTYWWIDKIIPRSAYRYQNIKNNEFHKCWSIKNMRPLPKNDCVKKGDKIIKELIEHYKLFDILPLGIIAMDNSKEIILRKELETYLKEFVGKLENQKYFDKDLYIRIMDISNSWNKAEILGIMVDKIRVFQDYNEKEINFDYKSYLDILLQ